VALHVRHGEQRAPQVVVRQDAGGVTAGIGFLGAGAILKQRDKNDIRGLTTAASVWLTAAVGIAAGMGREATAVLSALFALVILAILRAPRRRPVRERPQQK